MGMIHIKRIYAAPEPDDGCRVLIDRLWPRGVSRQTADLDLWLKDIAPSPDLRRWFAHDPARFDAFRQKYRDELAHNTEVVEQLLGRAKEQNITLLYAARDPVMNHAAVLAEFLAGVTKPT